MSTFRERRQKRRRTEEVLSWFLVPFVLIVVWFVGYQVWNTMFPERGRVVQSTRPGVPAPPR